MDHMPKWYQELTKAMKNKKPKQISPEKQAVINYLKQCIKELES